ncbi:MAG: secretin N-terminal domain-containing protein [Magnetococcus sp. MYC-9]
MNARGRARRRWPAGLLLCVSVLFGTGCTSLAGKGRLTSLEMRDAALNWESGSGHEAPERRVPEQLFNGQMTFRLASPARGVGTAPEGPWTQRNPSSLPERELGRRITVHVVRTPARAFFESLVSQDPSFNMVVHPDVDEEISVELKNVRVDEVVEIVCEMYQLDCQPFASRSQPTVRGYKIYPWQLTTRTYPVDFLSVVRDGYSQTTVSSGNRQEVMTTRTNKDQSKSTTTLPSTPGSGMRTEYKSDFWTDLENTITSILQLGLVIAKVTEETDEQGRTSRSVTRERKGAPRAGTTETQVRFKKKGVSIETSRVPVPKEKPADPPPPVPETETALMPSEKGVVINRQAGLITVRAYPREHQEITTFLDQLRSRSQRQVILEAKILEVTLNDGAQFGIDWLAVHRGIGGSTPPLSSEPRGGGTFFGKSSVGGQTRSVTTVFDDTDGSTVQSVTQSDTNAPTGVASVVTNALLLSRAAGADQPFNLALRANDFIGFVHLLQQQGKVQVLSSPRVATVNNQKAVIKVGSDEFFITGMNPGSVVGSGSDRVVNPSTISIESMFTGISLDVTPQVGEGEMITLHIHPLVTDVQDKTKQFVIDEKPQSLPLAFTQTRETDSIIRVRNGEVAVIGGLMKNRSREHEDRLPVLGELPVLGALFGHEEKRWEKSELVILLRPVVVDSRQDWGGQVVRAAERLHGMAPSPP